MATILQTWESLSPARPNSKSWTATSRKTQSWRFNYPQFFAQVSRVYDDRPTNVGPVMWPKTQETDWAAFNTEARHNSTGISTHSGLV